MSCRKILLMLVIFSLVISNIGITKVAAEEQKVIKVGFPVQKGLTEKDEDGNYTGYTVDYLKEIKKYTDWDYEFIEVDGNINEQINTLLEMLQNGEIDLLGTMKYSDALAEIYDYPGYHYGMAYTSLAVRSDDDRWIGSFSNWNEMTVGIYPGLIKREQELKKFAELNGFSYELVEFDTYDELLEAIQDGRVDATILVDISLPPGVKTIAKFTPVPFYFATTKGNKEIITKLNNALSSLNSANPYFQTELHEAYFSNSNQFTISEKNKKYIESLGTVNVLMFDGNAPIQYDDGEPKGVSVSYLEAFKETTGLEYKIFVAENYDDFKEMMEKQDIDLVLGISTVSDLIEEWNLTLSLPYIDNPSVKVSCSANSTSSKVDKIPVKEINNTLSVLEQINTNKIIEASLDLYSVNFYLERFKRFNTIRIEPSEVHNHQYAIGLVDKNETTLLSIINNFISSVSSEEVQKMIYENSNVHVEYAFKDFIQAYYLQISIFILLLILFVLLLYLKIKLNHHKELALQNRRFTELSNLTNECIFEYDYERDVMNIQNNNIIFEKRHQIEAFMKYEKYDFLKEIIKARQDTSHDFLLQDQEENRWYRVNLKVIRAQNNKVSYALGRIFDVHEEILKQKTLIEKSRRDALTNLLNRKGGEESIEALLEQDPTLGIMILLDVDNFKAINDNLGHIVGDQFLKEISNLIDSFFKPIDVKCRLGGDEFIIFIHQMMDKEYLSNKLELFIQKANEQLFSKYQDYDVSFSIGVTRVSEGVTTYKDLYRKADEAMYRIKMQGKNNYYIDDYENFRLN